MLSNHKSWVCEPSQLLFHYIDGKQQAHKHDRWLCDLWGRGRTERFTSHFEETKEKALPIPAKLFLFLELDQHKDLPRG